MHRRTCVSVVILILLACLSLPPASHAVPVLPGQGVAFRQVDLTFDGAAQTDSRYGMVIVDFATLMAATGISEGYLNVALSPTTWDVRNLVVSQASGLGGISTIFDLGAAGDVVSLQAHVEFSALPVTTFTAVPDQVFEVLPVQYNAQGRSSPLPSPPSGSPGIENLAFSELGFFRAPTWQSLAANIEQDQGQCGPAAVANSIQWLEDTGILSAVPESHVPGIRDISLVGTLDLKMGRPAHEGVNDLPALEGKLTYIDTLPTSGLRCDHKNRPGTTFVPNTVVMQGSTPSWPNLNNGMSLIEWVIQEVSRGEDVELGIGWPEGGGHWVRVCGGGYVLGVPWIAFVHDALQGFADPAGTPGDPDDDVTALNGGVSWWDGGLGFAYAPADQFAGFIGAATADLAFAESPTISYENKTVHKGEGEDAYDLEIVLLGLCQVVGHYDGSQGWWHFNNFTCTQVGGNTVLHWQAPADAAGTPGAISTCTTIHIGWATTSPAMIISMVWTDINGDPIGDAGRIYQIGAHLHDARGYPEEPTLRLSNDLETGTAEISQVYAGIIDYAYLLEDLNEDNPAFALQNMTLIEEGPLLLAPGESVDLHVPLTANLGQFLIYRLNGGGNNDYVDFGQIPLAQVEEAGIEGPDAPRTKMVALAPAEPNPFRSGTTIRYSVAVPGRLTLRVYNAEGALVRTLVDERVAAPQLDRSVAWDGTDTSGKPLSNGEYFLKLDCGGFEDVHRVIYMK